MEGAMRIKTCASLLSLAVAASCATDPVVGPPPVTHLPATSTLIDLSVTALAPLYASIALAINDSGVIVGFAQRDSLSPAKAVVWRPPSYRIEFLPDESSLGASSALAIGADGTIGGDVCDANDGSSPCHPAYWRAGVLHRLAGEGSIQSICPCDSHTMVGRTRVGGFDHGALWVDDILIDVGTPPGYTDGQLQSVSHGYFVGNGLDEVSNGGATANGAFRWSPSGGWVRLQSDMQTLAYDVNREGTAIGALGEIWIAGSNAHSQLPMGSMPAAINDSGVVAGMFFPQDDGALPDDPTPGVWTSSTGWISLGSLRKPGVTDINNAGLVVGYRDFLGRGIALLWKR
jgi:hypothetical protein